MAFIKKLYDKKFLLSFLLCFIIGGVIFAACGFRFAYYTNDDYQISFYLTKGESHSLYLNYFLSSILSIIQQFVPYINCFIVLQHICCFFSMVIIMYVLLNKMDRIIGLIVSISICSFVFITNILLVQYSQTPIVMCVAGAVLAAYATLFESNKKYRILQITVSIVIIITASLFRFVPFLLCLGFFFLFVFCTIFTLFADTDKSKSYFSRLCMCLRHCFALILVLIISFLVSCGFYLVSETINSSDASYSQYVAYNDARMRVKDYEIVPYEGHEEFYNSIGINSKVELTMLEFDKDLYDAEVLNKIADYSEMIVQDGDSKPVYAIKKTAERLIRSMKDVDETILSIKDAIGLPIENNLFMLLVVTLVIGLFILFIYIKNRLTIKNKITIKPLEQLLIISIVVAWILFFIVAKINGHNFLFVLLCLIVLVALFFDESHKYLAYVIFTLAPMSIYLYQFNFRISFRVTFAFLFPSIIFMLFLIKLPKIKVPFKELSRLISYFLLSLSFIIISIGSLFLLYPECSLRFDMQLRDYIEEHSDNNFIIRIPTNACVDEGYYNAFLVPDIPENEIMMCWSNSSDYFNNDLKARKIENLLLDSINSNNRIVIEENETNDLEKLKEDYEDFYNIHYFNGNDTIKLELEKSFSYNIQSDASWRNIREVGIYKVTRK